MNTMWIKIFALAGLAILAGCSPYRDIYTNYDKNVNFYNYSTFAWVPDTVSREKPPEGDMGYDNDIIRNNAKNYINTALTKRGMLVDIDSPDVLFQLVLLNEKKEKVLTYHNPPVGYYYYYSPYYFPYYYPYYRYYTWYGWNYPPFWDHQPTTTYTATYIRGTVTINMYDRKDMKLVWTGSAEGDIYDPLYIHLDVHPAIDRIMRKFPIKTAPYPRHDDRPKSKSPMVRMHEDRQRLGFNR